MTSIESKNRHSQSSIGFKIYQNGSKDGRYYIAEDMHEQNLSCSELYHYGVKGMRWGVRKDRVKAHLSKSFNEARYSKQVQKVVNTKVGKTAKKPFTQLLMLKTLMILLLRLEKWPNLQKA